MAIRLRRVDGVLIAICAARSIPEDGDIYLDDEVHHALANKFSIDYTAEGWGNIPFDAEIGLLIKREESDNANRENWNQWMNKSVPPEHEVIDRAAGEGGSMEIANVTLFAFPDIEHATEHHCLIEYTDGHYESVELVNHDEYTPESFYDLWSSYIDQLKESE